MATRPDGQADFLKQASLLGLGASPFFACVDRLARSVESVPPAEVAADEGFWAEIRAGYHLGSDYINLENGYYCIVPEEIMQKHLAHVRDVNRQGSWYMRRHRADDKKALIAKLAEAASCSPSELTITRNATESLDLVIGGIDWKAGDEAVMAEQDYGSMLDMFELQARRHGVVNRVISVPNHPKSDDQIVDLYAAAITPKTRLLMVCQMINITGQILPVRKICEMAHARGVEVMVDGAHAFAHIDSNIPALGADYYGASLHKWLNAPLGSGILWVNKEKIPGLWPLLAEGGHEPGDMLRLGHTGTTPVHGDLAIADALEFHARLGPARKEARLRHLQRYWSQKVRDLPRIVVNTPREPKRACAIGNVGVDGIEPSELARRLLEEHRIWTVAIDRPGVRGVRITPNIYTLTAELDALVSALDTIRRS